MHGGGQGFKSPHLHPFLEALDKRWAIVYNLSGVKEAMNLDSERKLNMDC